jgi:hypothetical protein
MSKLHFREIIPAVDRSSGMGRRKAGERSALIACLCTCLLAACAASGKVPEEGVGPVEISGVRIANELKYGVTDAQILILKSGNFVSCGNILSGTTCFTSFPGRVYEGGKLRITWKERGVAKVTPDFALKTEAFSGMGKALWVDVLIFAPGEAGAKLILPEKAE